MILLKTIYFWTFLKLLDTLFFVFCFVVFLGYDISRTNQSLCTRFGEKLLWKDKLIYLLKKVVRVKLLPLYRPDTCVTYLPGLYTTHREGAGGRWDLLYSTVEFYAYSNNRIKSLTSIYLGWNVFRAEAPHSMFIY